MKTTSGRLYSRGKTRISVTNNHSQHSYCYSHYCLLTSVSVRLLFPGEAGLSQAEQEDVVSGFIPRLPEAVYVSGADQSAGATETPQRPLPHQNQRQQQRVQVGIVCHSTGQFGLSEVLFCQCIQVSECVFDVCDVSERSGSGCRLSAH